MKILGLVFGSTCFEWAVFCVFAIVEIFFAETSTISLQKILLFNLSIAFSGVFFHTVAVMLALMSSGKKKNLSPVMFLLGIWFLGPLISMGATYFFPFFSHLLGLVAFKLIFSESITGLDRWFFIFDLHWFVMQMLVQIPLFILVVKGMDRIFRSPNNPTFSKADVIRLCVFLLLMVTGSSVAAYTHFGELLSSNDYFVGYRWSGGYQFRTFNLSQVSLFMTVYMALGIIASLFLVPTYFKCSKYAALRSKGLIRKEPLLDDGATSLLPILIYVCLGCLFFVFYVCGMQVSLMQGFFCVLWTSSYIVGFAGLLEYYRLSQFRNNKIFIVTALLLLWVVIPWISFLIFKLDFDHINFLASLNPFLGIGAAISSLLDAKSMDMALWGTPWAVAGLVWVMAWKERSVVEEVR